MATKHVKTPQNHSNFKSFWKSPTEKSMVSLRKIMNFIKNVKVSTKMISFRRETIDFSVGDFQKLSKNCWFCCVFICFAAIRDFQNFQNSQNFQNLGFGWQGGVGRDRAGYSESISGQGVLSLFNYFNDNCYFSQGIHRFLCGRILKTFKNTYFSRAQITCICEGPVVGRSGM